MPDALPILAICPGCRRTVLSVRWALDAVSNRESRPPARKAGVHGRSAAIHGPAPHGPCSKLPRKSPQWQGILTRLVDASCECVRCEGGRRPESPEIFDPLPNNSRPNIGRRLGPSQIRRKGNIRQVDYLKASQASLGGRPLHLAREWQIALTSGKKWFGARPVPNPARPALRLEKI